MTPLDEESEAAAADSTDARMARALGFVGLMPFVVLSVWLFAIAPDHEWRSGTIRLLLTYGAVILSFLGGSRWGLALSQPRATERVDYLLAVLPPLIGWLDLMLPVPYCFAVLAVAFAAQGASDTLAVHRHRAPRWYGRLRTLLTVLVVATMILAFVATS